MRRQALEILFITLVVWLVTEPYRTGVTLEHHRLAGIEAEWLTSAAYFAGHQLREFGRIPLWNPYLEYGEPLFESPFSFLLNPISTLPTLLLGGRGILVSVILSAWVAAIGGWFLGRVLDLCAVARVLLGLLLLGKGNMVAMLGTGFFQLGTAQAYFPWIVAGMIAIFRYRDARWPVFLTAISFALLFFAGNLWYTLPMLISLVLLASVYLVMNQERYRMMHRLAFAAMMVLGFSAVTLIPLWVHRSYIIEHPPVDAAGQMIGLDTAMATYFGDTDLAIQFYQSLVVPGWIAALLLIFIPSRKHLALWIVSASLVAFFTVWGAGQLYLFYDAIELWRRWRFVGRALAVGAFWIAILVALRVDGWWRLFSELKGRLRLAALGMLIGLCGLASFETLRQWDVFSGAVRVSQRDTACLEFLRENHPDEQIAVFRGLYDVIYPFIDHDIRLYNIEAAFGWDSLPNTMSDRATMRSLPPYALVWNDSDRQIVTGMGYQPLAGAPECLYTKPDAPPYAYMLDNLPTESVVASDVLPVNNIQHAMDTIHLTASGHPNQERLVVVSENAYPGWRVEIDGEMAQVESVGGLLGVWLPTESKEFEVRFAYRPPLLSGGAIISGLTFLVSILYVLRCSQSRKVEEPIG